MEGGQFFLRHLLVSEHVLKTVLIRGLPCLTGSTVEFQNNMALPHFISPCPQIQAPYSRNAKYSINSPPNIGPFSLKVEFNFYFFFFIEFLLYTVQSLLFGSGNGFSLNPTAVIFSLILPTFVGDWPLDILGQA